MKRPILVVLSLLAALALPGCMLATANGRVVVYDPPAPYYVYTYPDGCWADDVWYAPCPWTPGPSYGYYAYWRGGFFLQPQYRWSYRPGFPPPPYWHGYAPVRPYPGRPIYPAPSHGGPPRRF